MEYMCLLLALAQLTQLLSFDLWLGDVRSDFGDVMRRAIRYLIGAGKWQVCAIGEVLRLAIT